MLSDGDVASMRQTASRSLGSICNVISVERTRDAVGNVIEATVTGPDFDCHVAAISAEREGEVLQQIESVNGYRLMFPVDVEVDHTDRVLVDVEGELTMLEVVAQSNLATYLPLHSIIAVLVP